MMIFTGSRAKFPEIFLLSHWMASKLFLHRGIFVNFTQSKLDPAASKDQKKKTLNRFSAKSTVFNFWFLPNFQGSRRNSRFSKTILGFRAIFPRFCPGCPGWVPKLQVFQDSWELCWTTSWIRPDVSKSDYVPDFCREAGWPRLPPGFRVRFRFVGGVCWLMTKQVEALGRTYLGVVVVVLLMAKRLKHLVVSVCEPLVPQWRRVLLAPYWLILKRNEKKVLKCLSNNFWWETPDDCVGVSRKMGKEGGATGSRKLRPSFGLCVVESENNVQEKHRIKRIKGMHVPWSVLLLFAAWTFPERVLFTDQCSFCAQPGPFLLCVRSHCMFSEQCTAKTSQNTLSLFWKLFPEKACRLAFFPFPFVYIYSFVGQSRRAKTAEHLGRVGANIRPETPTGFLRTDKICSREPNNEDSGKMDGPLCGITDCPLIHYDWVASISRNQHVMSGRRPQLSQSLLPIETQCTRSAFDPKSPKPYEYKMGE